MNNDIILIHTLINKFNINFNDYYKVNLIAYLIDKVYGITIGEFNITPKGPLNHNINSLCERNSPINEPLQNSNLDNYKLLIESFETFKTVINSFFQSTEKYNLLVLYSIYDFLKTRMNFDSNIAFNEIQRFNFENSNINFDSFIDLDKKLYDIKNDFFNNPDINHQTNLKEKVLV